MHFKMLSAICFNLDQSKILSSGNGLKKYNLSKLTHIVILQIGFPKQTFSLDLESDCKFCTYNP